MKIGINTLFLIPNRVGGTEYYTRSFLSHLELQDKYNFYIIFCNKENINTFNFKNSKWKKVLCPINAKNRLIRILYEQIIFPFVVNNNRCDILHSFGYFGPVLGNYNKIVTVHDVNWKDFPGDISSIQIIVLNLLISLNILVSNIIITDSEYSKNRLIYYFPREKYKFKVIPVAIEDDFIELLKDTNKSIIDGDYLLCVSNFYPHKRIPYLISLFKEIEMINKQLKLVLVGRDGSDEKFVKESIKGNNKIIHFVKVNYPELVNLYKYAAALVFPSIYEGFGYPVYEAAAAGIPIFVGNRDFYDPDLKKNIFQLNFNNNDVININKNIKIKKYYKTSLNYDNSVKMLIDCYLKII